jgi:hypothetical protein
MRIDVNEFTSDAAARSKFPGMGLAHRCNQCEAVQLGAMRRAINDDGCVSI